MNEGHNTQGNILFKRLPAFPYAALETQTAHQTRDDPLDAGPEPLQVPEPALFLLLPSLGTAVAGLDDRHPLDALTVGCLFVLGTEKAAVGAQHMRRATKLALVFIQHLRPQFVGSGISPQNLILVDQTGLTGGEKHLVPELGRAHAFSATNDVGVLLENRHDLLFGRHFFAREDDPARSRFAALEREPAV